MALETHILIKKVCSINIYPIIKWPANELSKFFAESFPFWAQMNMRKNLKRAKNSLQVWWFSKLPSFTSYDLCGCIWVFQFLMKKYYIENCALKLNVIASSQEINWNFPSVFTRRGAISDNNKFAEKNINQ